MLCKGTQFSGETLMVDEWLDWMMILEIFSNLGDLHMSILSKEAGQIASLL